MPEDLYELNRSPKFNSAVESQQRVVNVQNKLRGVQSRRGDGTFGEIVPHAAAVSVPGFKVLRGTIATVEIGAEVKILSNSMIKQIDRVKTDLSNQVSEFKRAGGTPISVGIVGINHADRYTSYEGDVAWPTGPEKRKKHPIQEAAEAERRLRADIEPLFDEFLVLRFKAWNEPPFQFEWVDGKHTLMDYGAILTRILRKYDARF